MAVEGSFTGIPLVKVDGAALPDGAKELLEQVIVDDHLHMPDTAVLIFRDPGRTVVVDSKFKIGSALILEATTSGDHTAEAEPLFAGEVTGLEGEYGGEGERVVVRAYDYSHRLHRGTRTFHYVNVSDADIAKKIAGRHGFSSDVDSSGSIHEHTSQINLSDWEFLKGRAREIGFEVGVKQKKLYFKKKPINEGAPSAGTTGETAPSPLALTYKGNLLEFHPRVSAVAQVEKVTARGWDFEKKDKIVGESPTASGAGNSSPEIPHKAGQLATVFPAPDYMVTDRPLKNKAEATMIAQGTARQISSALGEADGICRGEPKVCAGAAVTVAVVSPDFCGKWTVTASRHVFTAAGYKTYFTVGGRQERSMLGLATLGSSAGAPSAGGPPVYGFVIGLVTNVKDPKNWYRVKLKFPWLSDDYETDWVRMTQFGAGKERGSVFLPEVNDEVLVGFEHGDVRRPFVIGSLYNGKDIPHKGSAVAGSGEVVIRGFRSKNKHQFTMYDGNGKDGISINSGDRKLKIVVNQTQQKITIHSDGKIEMDAIGDVSISSKANIDIKATGKLTMSGTAGVDLTSSAITNVKGSMVNIN